MKILVTGFDPFGGETINPAFEAVKALPQKIKEATIITAEVPTVFYQSAELVDALIAKHGVDVVLNIGQAGGRFGLSLERLAINLDDGRIADNIGQQPLDQVIQADGATAYFTQLPVKAMVAAIQKMGLPSYVSYTAGTYVCNHLMYQVQYLQATKYPHLKAGFIHVPFLPEQVCQKTQQPSMSQIDITRGLVIAIETLIDFHEVDDLKVVGGALH